MLRGTGSPGSYAEPIRTKASCAPVLTSSNPVFTRRVSSPPRPACRRCRRG